MKRHCWSCRSFRDCKRANGIGSKKACKEHTYADGLRREIVTKKTGHKQ